MGSEMCIRDSFSRLCKQCKFTTGAIFKEAVLSEIIESLIKDILINITEYNFNPIFRDLSRLTENLIGKLKTCHDCVSIFINLETIIKNGILLYMEELLNVHWVAENLVNKESENNNKPSEFLNTATKEVSWPNMNLPK